MKAAKLNPELLDPEKYDENKVKEAAETLLEADEIRADEVLMKNVAKYLEEHGNKIKNLSDLKDRAGANKFKSSQDEATLEE